MIKEIIRPKTQTYTITLPKEYVNRDIMIQAEIISPEAIKTDGSSDIIKRTSGILSSKNIDPITWQKKIRDEWEDRI